MPEDRPCEQANGDNRKPDFQDGASPELARCVRLSRLTRADLESVGWGSNKGK